jgi:flagellar protein FlaG
MATIQSIGSFQPIRESGNGKDLPETSLTHNTAGSVAVENVKQTNQVVAPQQPEGSAKAKDGLGAEELQQQLEKFAQSEQTIRRSLRFKVDTDTGSTIIKVIDRKTDETIRQIPPEELLTLSKRLKELNEDMSKAQGILIQTEA